MGRLCGFLDPQPSIDTVDGMTGQEIPSQWGKTEAKRIQGANLSMSTSGKVLLGPALEPPDGPVPAAAAKCLRVLQRAAAIRCYLLSHPSCIAWAFGSQSTGHLAGWPAPIFGLYFDLDGFDDEIFVSLSLLNF